ncbi:MAG: calcium-translocating P-type ATPase, PMCA-type [Candidatus Levybacteria bacterium]|nr:calcium-translocating P-type ATPase, PMCA-type [Candidatus Levybacteria bacterium]
MQLQNPYSQPIESILEKLNTTESGLSNDEAEKRLKEYGLNQLKPPKKASLISLYLKQFKNTLTIILLAATFLIFFIYFLGDRDASNLIEAGLILAIILMTTILGFVQEFKAEKAIEALKKILAYKTKVVRQGKTQEIDVKYLVPGDIVVLEEGAKIPGDIRIIKAFSLRVNEAPLTGESNPVGKEVNVLTGNKQIADQKNMVFSGTSVASGRGMGIVITTGNQTIIGKIARDVSETKEDQTPIQKRLDEVGKMIGYIILGICLLVFVFIVFLAKDFNTLSLTQRIIHSFIASVALAVAAVPEGLAAVVTISLAFGTQRMLKKNALIRKLNSVETLGSTDIICSDKTGTLTRGEMTVRNIYYDGLNYEVSGVGYETSGEFSLRNKKVNPNIFKLLLEIGLLCNNASLSSENKIGDPTEIALLVSAKKGEVNTNLDRVHEIPFTSERKLMSIVLRDRETYLIYTKGAPEIILAKCSYVLKKEKEPTITREDRKNILKINEEMSSKALRSLGFGYKKLTEAEYKEQLKDEKNLEKDLTFVGIQGMIDPPRAEVKSLIENLDNSGIRVIMITGDHSLTAQAVAKDVGITGSTLTGDDLDKMTDQEFEDKVENISIYARVNPSVKMRIVDALKKKGHIVAMTGDGVNDAPALKRADIGIAMGISGTDVAKEASDMVLLDDHFSTIVSAIEEGRGIFQNISKFVNYLLSCNIGEVLVVFIGLMIFQKLPLTATMLLWINVVTDGLPAVALGLDPPEKGILNHSPKLFQGKIINKKLLAEMFIYGLLMTIAVLGIFSISINEGTSQARASAFTAIVMLELIMLYIIRSRFKTSFFSNVWLVLAVFVTVAIQALIAYVPFVSNLFKIENLRLFESIYIILSCFVLWIVFKSILRLLSLTYKYHLPQT